MSYLLAFAGFAALIILHEFGHFAAAKAVGMRVERFSLFFPPLIARASAKPSTRRGGPARRLREDHRDEPEGGIPPEIVHRAYFRQKVWKRVVVIAAGPAMNFLIAFAFIWVLRLSLGQVPHAPVVDQVDEGQPRRRGARPATGSSRSTAPPATPRA